MSLDAEKMGKAMQAAIDKVIADAQPGTPAAEAILIAMGKVTVDFLTGENTSGQNPDGLAAKVEIYDKNGKLTTNMGKIV